MARIYRLEHKTIKPKLYPKTPTFISVYCASIIWDSHRNLLSPDDIIELQRTYRVLIRNHNKGDYRLAPYEDGITDFNSVKDFCGSPSVDDLLDWFEIGFEQFLRLGFVIREYIVDSTKISDSGLQCIARYSEVKKSKIIELNLVL